MPSLHTFLQRFSESNVMHEREEGRLFITGKSTPQGGLHGRVQDGLQIFILKKDVHKTAKTQRGQGNEQ